MSNYQPKNYPAGTKLKCVRLLAFYEGLPPGTEIGLQINEADQLLKSGGAEFVPSTTPKKELPAIPNANTPTAPYAVAGLTADDILADVAKSEKTSPMVGVTVTLRDVGPDKIDVIRVVREAGGLNLQEAKDMVEKLPSVIGVGMSKESADALVTQLEAVGATAVATDRPAPAVDRAMPEPRHHAGPVVPQPKKHKR